ASMELFNLEASGKQGADITNRNQFFKKTVENVFEEIYADKTCAPENIIHVTCTGYTSPSAAQWICSQNQWNAEVFHAYHMGCYASIPALKVAKGCLQSSKSADIVHTELCTIHFDPSNHSPEQLVVQSLFADGVIKYTASKDVP